MSIGKGREDHLFIPMIYLESSMFIFGGDSLENIAYG